jgi:hypothetical protein
MRKLILIACLCMAAFLPACAETKSAKPGVFRVSGNPAPWNIPGFGSKWSFVYEHIRGGYEVDMENTSTFGLYVGFDDICYGRHHDIDVRAVSIDCFYYPFTSVDDPKAKPFLSAGLVHNHVYYSGYYPKLKEKPGFQIGAGLCTGSVVGLFFHVFYRDFNMRVCPNEHEVWPWSRNLEVSGFFAEWGVTFRF